MPLFFLGISGLHGNSPGLPRVTRALLSPQLNGTSISSATPNSTVRSALGGTIYHSPTSRLPPSGGKVRSCLGRACPAGWAGTAQLRLLSSTMLPGCKGPDVPVLCDPGRVLLGPEGGGGWQQRSGKPPPAWICSITLFLCAELGGTFKTWVWCCSFWDWRPWKLLELEAPLSWQSIGSEATAAPRAPLGFCVPSNCHFLLQFGQARTPSRVVKPPRPGYRQRNKENMSQLNGTTLSGGCTQTAPAQRNHSVNSVASTYSEFAVIHLF